MSPGKQCVVLGEDHSSSHGDIVHPCVRFIPEGFRGHTWWMVYTPYYNADASIENPILCWGDSEDSAPPLRWYVEDLIKEGESLGYNSDPYITYADAKLYAFWRENGTNRTKQDNGTHVTYCKVYSEDAVFLIDHPVLVEDKELSDKETCPSFLSRKGNDYAYCMDLVFKNETLQTKPFLRNCARVLSILGLYSEQKSNGVSLWSGHSLINKQLHYQKTTTFSNCNRLYRPWHMDIFEYDTVLYAVVQTNQCNADICLAYSTDYENFTFFSKPLITNATIGKVGLYKPSAVVKDGLFYLFYTAQDMNHRGHNKLYVTSCMFVDLLNKLR